MAMTDKQVRQKLNLLVAICNELDEEAKRRHGIDGNLFFEADGSFYLMSGDSGGPPSERQKYIEFTSDGFCALGAGAW